MMKTKALPKTKKKKAPKGQGFKLEAKPLTEQQIKDFVAHYNKYKSFPGSKIPCTISGKLTTCVGPWMVKKIKEFGGPEQLLRNYKCRGVLKKQVVKPVSAKAAKRKKFQELKDENKNWDLPKIDLNATPRALSNDELGEVTKTTCLRPDVFLDNDRACDGCEFFDVCNNSLKCLKKITKRRK